MISGIVVVKRLKTPMHRSHEAATFHSKGRYAAYADSTAVASALAELFNGRRVPASVLSAAPCACVGHLSSSDTLKRDLLVCLPKPWCCKSDTSAEQQALLRPAAPEAEIQMC